MLTLQAPPHRCPDDLRRMAIVMGVAALDTYMHRLVVHRVYEHKKLPNGIANLRMSFEHALEQADESNAVARAAPKKTRPRVALKRALRERLLRDSFQSFDSVSNALGMAGLKKQWQPIGANMTPVQTTDQIKERLNGIVRRRNQIAHEGDYVRLEKPQTARTNSITQAAADSDIAYLENLIDAIHTTY